jgi:hypothetical protein
MLAAEFGWTIPALLLEKLLAIYLGVRGNITQTSKQGTTTAKQILGG